MIDKTGKNTGKNLTHKTFAYIRVSSNDQNIDRQLTAIKEHISDERNIFIDKVSGRDFNRPELGNLKKNNQGRGYTDLLKSLIDLVVIQHR